MTRASCLLLLVWGAAALVLTLSGVLSGLPRPAIPLALFGPVIAFFVASRRPGAARRIAATLDLRAAVAFHIPRAAMGLGFLAAAASGSMPAELATPAGWGDLTTGLLAIAALFALPRRPGLAALWNLYGLLDIVMVVVAAQRIIIFGEPGPAFFAFPFPLLPLFYVPLVFISHGILLARLAGRYRSAAPVAPAQAVPRM